MQYELQGREGMRALEMNRTPALRAGMAPIATSARVAAAIAGLPPVPPDAADVMTGNVAAVVAKMVAAKAAPGVATAPGTPVQELVAEEVPKAKAKAKATILSGPPPKSTSSSSGLPPLFGGKAS